MRADSVTCSGPALQASGVKEFAWISAPVSRWLPAPWAFIWMFNSFSLIRSGWAAIQGKGSWESFRFVFVATLIASIAFAFLSRVLPPERRRLVVDDEGLAILGTYRNIFGWTSDDPIRRYGRWHVRWSEVNRARVMRESNETIVRFSPADSRNRESRLVLARIDGRFENEERLLAEMARHLPVERLFP